MSPADGLLAKEEPEEEEEETKDLAVWVGSCSSHGYADTVMEYAGSFTSVELCLNECKNCCFKITFSLSCPLPIQDIDIEDFPILCLTMVGDIVWMGFELDISVFMTPRPVSLCLKLVTPFQLYRAMLD